MLETQLRDLRGLLDRRGYNKSSRKGDPRPESDGRRLEGLKPEEVIGRIEVRSWFDTDFHTEEGRRMRWSRGQVRKPTTT